MFTITINDIDLVLKDFCIIGKCTEFSELQRYYYEKDDPLSTEVRLIIKVVLDNGGELVVRFKNEKDVTLDIINDQSRFAKLLRNNGIETPKVYSSNGHFARLYQFGNYAVIVTIEEFVYGELTEIDAETSEKIGCLLAHMHNIAESKAFHIKNDVLFNPLKTNDLFSFESFTALKDPLVFIDHTLYDEIIDLYSDHIKKVRIFENEPQYAVQGDISDCNLYRTASGEIGVFDFNRCGDNVPYYDAVMQAVFEARLMAYPNDIAENPETKILPAFLTGYHRLRPFTDKQIEVYPYLYAIISAFWSGDIIWDDNSLTNAVKNNDQNEALKWMKKIRSRLTHLVSMPV